MARPLICPGGYPVPEKEGIHEIVGISAVPTVVGSAMEVTIRDDWRNDQTYDPDHNKHELLHFKSDGNMSIFHLFPTQIKCLRGLRATTLTNATRVQVYVR
jgi:hypothetical protein